MLVDREGGSFLYGIDQFCLLSSFLQACWPTPQSQTTAHCPLCPILLSQDHWLMPSVPTLSQAGLQCSHWPAQGSRDNSGHGGGWSCP